MGILAWIRRRFTGPPEAPPPTPDTPPATTEAAPAAPEAADGATPPWKAKKRKKKRARGTGTRKKRKNRQGRASTATTPPPSTPRTSTLGPIVEVSMAPHPAGPPIPSDASASGEARPATTATTPAPADPPAAPTDAPAAPTDAPATPPPQSSSTDPPRRARRRDQASQEDAYRVWAASRQLEGLLQKVDDVLAEADLDIPRLQATRQRLRDGWKALGGPPPGAAHPAGAALAERLAAMDARMATLEAAWQAAIDAEVAARITLIEQAEAAVDDENLDRATAELRRVRAALRSGDPLPPDRFAPLRARWRAVSDRLGARHAVIRAAQDAERAHSLAQREQLALSAEALANARDPVAAGEQIKALQARWKQLPHAGRGADAQAVWGRFRGAADLVFERRRAFVDAQHAENVAAKQALIERARALADEDVVDMDGALDELHRAWKRVGRVPRAVADPLWKEFRAACQEARTPPPIPDAVRGEDGGLRFQPFAAIQGPDDTDP